MQEDVAVCCEPAVDFIIRKTVSPKFRLIHCQLPCAILHLFPYVASVINLCDLYVTN